MARIRSPLASLLFLAAALPAAASVPSPFNSTTPNCIAACPLGDIPTTIVVRDIANNVIANSTVVIDFSNCSGAFLCQFPPPPYNQNLAQRTVSLQTDATGTVTFPLHVGGTCGSNLVRIFADGVLLKQTALASPDQTGNGVVVCFAIDTDCSVFGPKLNTSDPTADFDCNGTVDLFDEIALMGHVSHACEGIVDPARRSSWGRVKAFYR